MAEWSSLEDVLGDIVSLNDFGDGGDLGMDINEDIWVGQEKKSADIPSSYLPINPPQISQAPHHSMVQKSIVKDMKNAQISFEPDFSHFNSKKKSETKKRETEKFFKKNNNTNDWQPVPTEKNNEWAPIIPKQFSVRREEFPALGK